MEDGFTLIAHVAGRKRQVIAQFDGYSYTVTTTNSQIARSLHDALNVAREHLGRFLASASPPDIAWGLYVSVGTVQAWYGEWPQPPGPSGPPAAPDSLVSKIRSRWNGSPRGALENAIEIIDAYTARRRAA
jgi:hypothetical protein